jgi:hypothetical protein
LYFDRLLPTICKIIWHHIPKDNNLHNYHCQNLKSHIGIQVVKRSGAEPHVFSFLYRSDFASMNHFFLL